MKSITSRLQLQIVIVLSYQLNWKLLMISAINIKEILRFDHLISDRDLKMINISQKFIPEQESGSIYIHDQVLYIPVEMSPSLHPITKIKVGNPPQTFRLVRSYLFSKVSRFRLR